MEGGDEEGCLTLNLCLYKPFRTGFGWRWGKMIYKSLLTE